MSLRYLIALVPSIVCFAVPAWGDFQAGMHAVERGDYATALLEWRPLAEQGDASAQFNLALLYAKGQGVPHDYVQAHKWFNLAGANGEQEAASLRDALAKKMTQDQIAEAQRLAREWKPKNP